jgi:hypothetical protein
MPVSSPTVIPISSTGSTKVATRLAFDGPIAAALKAGVRVEDFINMTRLARTPDSDAARFLDAWDALDPSEQCVPGAVDAVCDRLGLAPLQLLRVAAEAGCRFSVYLAQTRAALAYPAVMEKTVECALTDKGYADRVVLHKMMGFLPTPRGSQTAINVAVASVAASAVEQRGPIEPPEQTIRRLQQRFKERFLDTRGLPPSRLTAIPETERSARGPDEDEGGEHGSEG